MISQQVTAIALRALAIWLLLQVVLNSPGLILLLNESKYYRNQSIPIEVYSLVIGGFYAVGFTAAFLLNRLAGSVLKKMKSKEDVEVHLTIDSEKFLLQLLGAYFLVDSLVNLPGSLSSIIHTESVVMTQFFWPAGLLLQLLIGLSLISCSSFWSRILVILRGRGGL